MLCQGDRMSGPKLDDFADGVGETWEVAAEGAALPFRLEVAQALPRAMREEGGFRLEWLGPADPLLPQAVYGFSRGDAQCEMFIVPIARNEAGSRYEAIFC